MVGNCELMSVIWCAPPHVHLRHCRAGIRHLAGVMWCGGGLVLVLLWWCGGSDLIGALGSRL